MISLCFLMALRCLQQNVGDTSAIYFTVLCWKSSSSAGGANKLNKLPTKAVSVIGIILEMFESVRNRRSLNKLPSIIDNKSHHLHDTLLRQQTLFHKDMLCFRKKQMQKKKKSNPNLLNLYINYYVMIYVYKL